MIRFRYIVLLGVFILSNLLFSDKIKVVTEEFGPYNYSSNGEIEGFASEIVKEVLKRAEIDYEISVNPWKRSYEIAKQDSNVLIYSIARTALREPDFKWIGVIAELDVYFTKLKSRRDIDINSLEDAKKYKIGVVKDDIRYQFLVKDGFKDQLILAKDDGENIRNLFNHKIDFFPADKLVAYHMVHKEGYAFKDLEKQLFLSDVSIDIYIAFGKRSSNYLVEKCVRALSGIKRDGTYKKIKSKYDIFYLPEFHFGL
jgi:polar amino acid transport system substrate-binding protein